MGPASEWETRSGGRRSRARVIAGIAVAVIAVGGIARWGDTSPAAPGVLDVDVAETPEETRVRPSPRVTPRASRRPVPPPTPTPVPPPTPSPATASTWQLTPEAPVANRAEMAMVWTGAELVVWGGRTYGDSMSPFHADGAWFDPGSGVWEALPQSPLEGRALVGAVWTGSEVIVWGGMGRTGFLADGAAYDPARRSWRVLPPAPLTPRGNPVLLWTGADVLVLAGSDNSTGLVDGGRYDPRTDRWAPLPDLPLRPAMWGPPPAAAMGPGGPLVAVGDPQNVRPPEVVRLRDGAWHPLNVPADLALGDGQMLLAVAETAPDHVYLMLGAWVASGMGVRVVHGAAGGWEVLGSVPLSLGGEASAMVAGDDLFVVGEGGGAVFDTATRTWLALPQSGGLNAGGSLVHAGDALFAASPYAHDASIRLRLRWLAVPADVTPPRDAEDSAA